MKQKKCLKCGKTIPEGCRTCPDCYLIGSEPKGIPIRPRKKRINILYWIGVGSAIAWVLCVANFFYLANTQRSTTETGLYLWIILAGIIFFLLAIICLAISLGNQSRTNKRSADKLEKKTARRSKLYKLSFVILAGWILSVVSSTFTASTVPIFIGVVFFILAIMVYAGFNPVGLARGVIDKLFRLIMGFPKGVKYTLLVILLISLIFIGNRGYAYATARSFIMQAQELSEKGENSSAKEMLRKAYQIGLSKGQMSQVTELEKKISAEIDGNKNFNEAMEKYNSESWEEARDLFRKVDKGVTKYQEAQRKITECNSKIVEGLRSRALELANKYSVWWGESWANRDKRSREEILSGYNEQQLRDFIDKWENYSGGSRNIAIPKATMTPFTMPTSTYSPVSNEPPDYTNRISEFKNEIAKCNSAITKAKSDLVELESIHKQRLSDIEEWYNAQPKVNVCHSCGPRVLCCSMDHSDQDKTERQRRIDQENSLYFDTKRYLENIIEDITYVRIPSLEWIIKEIKNRRLPSPPEDYSYQKCE